MSASKTHEPALWARTRAVTFRIEAHAATRTSTEIAATDHDLPAAIARARFAQALNQCAEIMDRCADEIEEMR